MPTETITNENPQILRSRRPASEPPIWGRQKGVTPICSDFPVFFRFVPICAPCFREYPDLFRFAPISSDLLIFRTSQNKSGRPLSADPFCKSPTAAGVSRSSRGVSLKVREGVSHGCFRGPSGPRLQSVQKVSRKCPPSVKKVSQTLRDTLRHFLDAREPGALRAPKTPCGTLGQCRDTHVRDTPKDTSARRARGTLAAGPRDRNSGDFCSLSIRNGKANNFPQIILRICFRNDHDGHITACHTYDNSKSQVFSFALAFVEA